MEQSNAEWCTNKLWFPIWQPHLLHNTIYSHLKSRNSLILWFYLVIRIMKMGTFFCMRIVRYNLECNTIFTNYINNVKKRRGCCIRKTTIRIFVVSNISNHTQGRYNPFKLRVLMSFISSRTMGQCKTNDPWNFSKTLTTRDSCAVRTRHMLNGLEEFHRSLLAHCHSKPDKETQI
jgi:hypothetical protein